MSLWRAVGFRAVNILRREIVSIDLAGNFRLKLKDSAEWVSGWEYPCRDALPCPTRVLDRIHHNHSITLITIE